MRHFCFAFELQHQDGRRQENTHNDLKEGHKSQEINSAAITETIVSHARCQHKPSATVLALEVTTSARNLCITLLQPLKTCVALDCFVALSVMVFGNTLDTAPYVQKTFLPSAALLHTRQCREVREGEEGLKGAEQMEK